MIDITQIAVGIVAIAVAVITIYVIPVIKKSVTTEKLEEITNFIEVFVGAAEQLYEKEQTAEKKEYVQNLIKEKLKKLNLTIDEKELDAQIENAVLTLHNQLIQ